MSLKSSTAALTTAATAIVTPNSGNANVALKVALVPTADIYIGGADAQTFLVTTSGISLDVVAGDVIYAKAVTGTATVSILQAGV